MQCGLGFGREVDGGFECGKAFLGWLIKPLKLVAVDREAVPDDAGLAASRLETKSSNLAKRSCRSLFSALKDFSLSLTCRPLAKRLR